MKPVLLTRFVEQVGFSESLAGVAVAMPFVGIAASSVLLKYLFSHMNIRRLAAIFGAVLVISEFSSAFYFHVPGIVLVAQLLGGISVGTLMGATSRVIATTRMPDEIFGFVDMMAVFLMSFMIAGVGLFVALYGLRSDSPAGLRIRHLHGRLVCRDQCIQSNRIHDRPRAGDFFPAIQFPDSAGAVRIAGQGRAMGGYRDTVTDERFRVGGDRRRHHRRSLECRGVGNRYRSRYGRLPAVTDSFVRENSMNNGV